MLAQGVPHLLAGDEVGNSQKGNNNAYCQDNRIGWVDWSGVGREGDDLSDLIAQLAVLRRHFPQLRPRRWVEGRRADDSFGGAATFILHRDFAVQPDGTQALTNATLPYIKKLAAMGATRALLDDVHLANGLNVYRGEITHPAVAKSLGLHYQSFQDAA